MSCERLFNHISHTFESVKDACLGVSFIRRFGTSSLNPNPMNVCRTIAVVLSLVLSVPAPAPAADALHRREINQKNPGGKDLVMTFQELRRDEKISTAKVTFGSGASVASVMFIVQGFYDIARSRGATHFIKLKEWKDADGKWMYLIGFTRDKNVNPEQYFSLREPLPKDNEHRFMAVEDYDRFFKGRQ